MKSKIHTPFTKIKAQQIDGAQFQHGLNEAALTAERFAELFCNGRLKRVREWLSDEMPVPPWVPALLAAMGVADARARAIATAEHLLAMGTNSDKSSSRDRDE